MCAESAIVKSASDLLHTKPQMHVLYAIGLGKFPMETDFEIGGVYAGDTQGVQHSKLLYYVPIAQSWHSMTLIFSQHLP